MRFRMSEVPLYTQRSPCAMLRRVTRRSRGLIGESFILCWFLAMQVTTRQDHASYSNGVVIFIARNQLNHMISPVGMARPNVEAGLGVRPNVWCGV